MKPFCNKRFYGIELHSTKDWYKVAYKLAVIAIWTTVAMKLLQKEKLTRL